MASNKPNDIDDTVTVYKYTYNGKLKTRLGSWYPHNFASRMALANKKHGAPIMCLVRIKEWKNAQHS